MCRDSAADARPHSPHPFHHGRKVHADAGRHLRAEVFRIAHLSVQAGGANNRLGRYASDIEARAAKTIALYDGYLRAQFCGIEGREQSRRSSADDYQVVSVNRLGISPGRRVNV
jgi:hypothetical protein